MQSRCEKYRITVGRPQRKACRPRCKHNIEVDEQEIGYEKYDWIRFGHDGATPSGSCENGTEPSCLTKVGNFFSLWEIINFLR